MQMGTDCVPFCNFLLKKRRNFFWNENRLPPGEAENISAEADHIREEADHIREGADHISAEADKIGAEAGHTGKGRPLRAEADSYLELIEEPFRTRPAPI
jgi:hypothetical protein